MPLIAASSFNHREVKSLAGLPTLEEEAMRGLSLDAGDLSNPGKKLKAGLPETLLGGSFSENTKNSTRS